jgi:solute carrier family 12 (potassium/chloride transporters), member 9
LNAIAPIVTVLITLTYSFVNFSCFFLSITGAPNFRPTFKLFSWHTALGGALLSIASIFYVDVTYASLAIISQIALMFLIHFYAPNASWGDFSQALSLINFQFLTFQFIIKSENISSELIQENNI